MQTRRLGDGQTLFGVPRQNFTVARVKRDIFGRSSIGAIFVNRQGSLFTDATGRASETRYHRAAGVDAEFNLTDRFRINAFLMGTSNPGVKSSFLSGRVDTRYEDDNFRFIGDDNS